MKFVVAGPVLVPVPVNLPANAPILTATTTNIAPDNLSTSFPASQYTPVDPSPVPTTTTTTVAPTILPTTTNVPANSPTIFFHAPDPTITTTVPSNTPTPAVPEPDTTTTTCIYANHHTQNSPVPYPNPTPKHSPVPDPTPPPTYVAPVPDTPSHTTSTLTVVVDFHGVKWYDSEDVIDLDEVPSLQWNFTNKFGDPVYPNSSVWMSRIDAWLMMYGEKYLILSLTNTNLDLLKQGTRSFKDMAKALRFQGVVRLVNYFELGK